MTKIPPTLFIYIQFTWAGRISISTRGPRSKDQTTAQAEETFERLFWTVDVFPADATVSPIRMSTESSDIFCMMAASHQTAGFASVECMIEEEQATWDAHFMGAERDVDTFYSVLRGMH